MNLNLQMLEEKNNKKKQNKKNVPCERNGKVIKRKKKTCL